MKEGKGDMDRCESLSTEYDFPGVRPRVDPHPSFRASKYHCCRGLQPDADWIRQFVREQGAWANIPPKKNRTSLINFSPDLYRSRNLVERFFNKIKQCRRIATRYDKLADNYLAFIKLASIRLWIRAYESTP